MNLSDSRAAEDALFTERVRLLQAIYPKEHAALICWGAWSRDRRGIFPKDIAPPKVWDQFKRDENEAWGDEDAAKLEPETDAEVKAERAEDDPYNELQGHQLDERIHGYGGLWQEVRIALRVVYVRRDIHEIQYPRAAGCGQDALLERLAEGLKFVGRFT